MALIDEQWWRDACTRLVPSWVPWRVEVRHGAIVVDIGIRGLWTQLDVSSLGSSDDRDRALQELVRRWLGVMRGACDRELDRKPPTVGESS